MDEATAQQPPVEEKPKLTKEQRSAIMRDAAKRRWEKERKAKAKAAKAAKTSKPAPKIVKAKKKPSAPREFSSALKVAENRLARAIQEKAEAAARYASLSAEIPSLMAIINSLKNPTVPTMFPGAPYYGTIPAPPSLEQIVGDQPIHYQNPPRRTDIPAMPPQVPVIPVPQKLHPANATTGRAGGGAIGVELPANGDGGDEDEDKFLRESSVAGGAWH